MSRPLVAAETATRALLEISGLNAFYGSAQALEDVSFSDGTRVGRDRRPERHGQDDAVQRDHRHLAAARDGLDPVRGGRAGRRPVASRSRGAGSATSRRVDASSRRSRSISTSGSRPWRLVERRQRVDARARLRPLSASRRAQAQRRRAAVGRRAADARHRASARHESEDPRHGRAVGGSRPCRDRGARSRRSSCSRKRVSRSCSSSRTSASRRRSPSVSSS